MLYNLLNSAAPLPPLPFLPEQKQFIISANYTSRLLSGNSFSVSHSKKTSVSDVIEEKDGSTDAGCGEKEEDDSISDYSSSSSDSKNLTTDTNVGLVRSSSISTSVSRANTAAFIECLPVSKSSKSGSSSVCRHWIAGRCNVVSCRFVHPETNTPRVCRHWKMGRCNVIQCRFLHEDVPDLNNICTPVPLSKAVSNISRFH